MGSSKALTQSLALSMLLLLNLGMAPQAGTVTKIHNRPSSQALQEDDKQVDAILRQHRLIELADMHKQAAQEIKAQQLLAEQQQKEQQQAQAQQVQNQQAQVLQPQILNNVENYTNLSPDILSFIAQESNDKHVPMSIVLGLMEQESTFRTDAVNPNTGAIGLGQIERPTAVDLAARGGFDVGDLYDPKFNAKVVISYLNYLRNESGDWNATLTAYNRGLGGLFAYQRQNGTSVSDYSSSVLEKAQHIRETTGVS